MNKSLLALAALMMTFGLAACGNNDDPTTTTNGHDENDIGMESDNGENGTAEDNANGDNGTNGDNADGNAAGNGDGNNIERDQDAADKVATVEGVEDATVLLTDNNAYVGVNLSEGTDESEELKTKVSDAVKSVKPDTENVYVSANPDFAKQLSDYGDRIDEGEPVEGFFQEFTDLVQRAFPDAK